MSTTTELLRAGLSLVIVLAMLGGFARLARRRQAGRVFGTRPHEGQPVVIGRLGLGRSVQVAVVRIGKRDLVLGVAANRVELLTEAAVGEFAPEEAEANGHLDQLAQESFARKNSLRAASPTSAWTSVLEALRERTIRRA